MSLVVSIPESPGKRRALGAISTNTPTKLRESPAKAKFVAALVEAAPAPPLAAVFEAEPEAESRASPEAVAAPTAVVESAASSEAPPVSDEALDAEVAAITFIADTHEAALDARRKEFAVFRDIASLEAESATGETAEDDAEDAADALDFSPNADALLDEIEAELDGGAGGEAAPPAVEAAEAAVKTFEAAFEACEAAVKAEASSSPDSSMSIEALTEQFQTTLGEVEDERDEIYTAYQQKVDECTNLHEDVEAWSQRYDEILNEGRQLHAQFTARGERIKLMEREKLEDKARMEAMEKENSEVHRRAIRRNSARNSLSAPSATPTGAPRVRPAPAAGAGDRRPSAAGGRARDAAAGGGGGARARGLRGDGGAERAGGAPEARGRAGVEHAAAQRAEEARRGGDADGGGGGGEGGGPARVEPEA